ncbi:hypothetical protein LCGC14_1500440 [marine sediment metagenome]|uniref:Uncharacterized protein n=1 Tax=marine sediment metagenome TaxID=412755 RepID=A0A0F9J472_9ZZZZ
MATKGGITTNDGKWLRPYFRGTLAVIAVAATPMMLITNIEIPNEWWLVVSGIVGFYFGGEL